MNGLHVAATGRMMFDPEPRFTASGKALVTFSMVGDQGAVVATDEQAALLAAADVAEHENRAAGAK
jgi:hypothetical protein